MGNCSSKSDKQRSNYVSIMSIIKSANQRDNKKVHIGNKSDYYFFIEWLLNFRFYSNVSSDDADIKLLTKMNGLNDKNISKVAKVIDHVDDNDFNTFTQSATYNSYKSSNSKPLKLGVMINGNDKKNYIENSITNLELRNKVIYLFEKICKENFKKTQSLLIKGPPNNLRWLIWISIAMNRYSELHSKLGMTNEQIYLALLEHEGKWVKNENEIQNFNIKVILKNLPEKLRKIKYFKEGKGMDSLNKVKYALTLYDNELSYDDITNICLNALIFSDCNESEAFFLLRYLYSSEYGLKIREFFIKDSPLLTFYTFILSELISERLPRIYNTIKKMQIKPEKWIKSWLRELYTNLFDFSISVRLWDCIISLGLKFLLNFSLGYLKYFEVQIVKIYSIDEFINIFHKMSRFKYQKDAFDFREKIIKMSFKFIISDDTMKRLTAKYSKEYKPFQTSLTKEIELYEKYSEIERIKNIFFPGNNNKDNSKNNNNNNSNINNNNNLHDSISSEEEKCLETIDDSDEQNHIPNPTIQKQKLERAPRRGHSHQLLTKGDLELNSERSDESYRKTKALRGSPSEDEFIVNKIIDLPLSVNEEEFPKEIEIDLQPS